MNDPTAIYRTREWFESLTWQHRWIEFMVGWWVGEFGVPETVIDFGAGDGWWPHTFAEIGTKNPHAIELDEIALEFMPKNLYFTQHDLRQPLEASGISDLSICIEVAEHMTRQEAENVLVVNVLQHTGNLLLWSAAQPGQPGTGHINLQTQEHWIKVIEGRGGFKLSGERTGKARRAFERILPPDYHFLPRNLLIFARI